MDEEEKNVAAAKAEKDRKKAERLAKAEAEAEARASPDTQKKPKARAAVFALAEAEAEKKAAEEKAKAEAEANAWKEAKEAYARRQALKEEDQNAGTDLLSAIQRLATQAAEAEAHAKRAERLEKALGPEQAERMRSRARRTSKDLQESIAKMVDRDGALDKAFDQFDLDGNGTLEFEELSAAFEAASMPIADADLRKCIKLLDTNGDGVIDREEFKTIAIKVKMLTAEST